MHCSWIYYNEAVERRDGRWHSRTASVRYRMLMPAQALESRGHRVDLVSVTLDTPVAALAQVDGEVVVVSKIFAPTFDAFPRMSELGLAAIRAARQRGQRVVADISDHHFDHPVYGAYFRALVEEADLVVASTASMAEVVARYTSRPVEIVGDPYEGERGAPRLVPPSRRGGGLLAQAIRSLLAAGRKPVPLRLLWFGHGSNFDTFVEAVPHLMRLTARHFLELHVVTAATSGAGRVCEALDREYQPLCRVRFSEWSTQETAAALARCDVVVIPSRTADIGKSVKSPNRVVESLWAGRYVCAHRLPSYEEFSPYAHIGEDLVAGIEAALAAPRRARSRISAGQDYIAARYAPQVIGRRWEAVLERAAGGR